METENGCEGLKKTYEASSLAQEASDGKKKWWFEFDHHEKNSFNVPTLFPLSLKWTSRTLGEKLKLRTLSSRNHHN